MNALLMIAYEISSSLVPFLIAYLIFAKRLPPDKRELQERRAPLYCVFALYCAAVFFITGAGTIYDVFRTGDSIQLSFIYQIVLMPFPEGFDPGYALNILLFVPFGFLVPLLAPSMRTCWATTLFGFWFSFMIEISQLCNNRVTDINDLITNTLGALLGYAAFVLYATCSKKGYASDKSGGMVIVIYLSVMFLGRFVLYNEFGAAKLLFGF